MKRSSIRVLSIVLTLAILLCVSTTALASTAMDIIVSSVECYAGETVSITIDLKNNPGVSSLKMKVAYDADLTLQSVTYNTEMGGQTIQPQTMSSPVTLMWVRPFDEFSGEATFVTLVFSVAEDAQSGTTGINITYDPNDIYNLAEENIACTVQSGTVTIISDDVSDSEYITPAENTKIDYTNKYIYSGVWGASAWTSVVESTKPESISLSTNGQGYIGTGSTITVSNNNKENVYKVIVIGDVNGDSACDVLDATVVAAGLNGKILLPEDAKCAVTKALDTDITITDYQNLVNWVVADKITLDTKCTVSFADYDGTILKTEEIDSGDSALPPENPVRESYVFTGWDKSINNISKDETLTAQYAEVDGPTFAVEHVNAVAGSENVAVTISVLNNPGIASIGMRVAFDEALTLTSIEYNTEMGGQSVPPQNFSSPAKLTWVSPFANTTGDKVFATLYFTVSETATGELPVEITYIADDVYDMTETNIPFNIVNNSVLVIK